MRQLPNKTYCIGQQHILIGWEPQTPCGGIESGEEFVLCQHVRSSQAVQQGGLSGVGIAHDGGQRPVIALPRIALCRAVPPHEFQVPPEPGDTVLHPAAISFQLRFTFTAAHANAA